MTTRGQEARRMSEFGGKAGCLVGASKMTLMTQANTGRQEIEDVISFFETHEFSLKAASILATRSVAP